MEQLRLFLAIILSFLVFFLWNKFFVKNDTKQNFKNTKKIEKNISKIPSKEKSLSIDYNKENLEENSYDIEEKTINIETPLYILKLSNKGASIKSFVLKNYKDENNVPKEIVIKKGTFFSKLASEKNKNIFFSYNGDENINIDKGKKTLSFFYSFSNKIILEKRYTIDPDLYLINCDFIFKNNSKENITDEIVIYNFNLLSNKRQFSFEGPSILTDKKMLNIKTKKIEDKNKYEEFVKWFGFQTRYFLSAFIPEDKNNLLIEYKIKDEKLLETNLIIPLKDFYSQNTESFNFKVYIGPKSVSLLKNKLYKDYELDEAIHFGFFDIIAKFCLYLMNLIHKVIPNYGLAIIILTILTKLALWPLGTKSYKSMSEMKKLQPILSEIREKYKNDKEKMNKEVMNLYKTYKINPMGGCLPIVVQIPIFFGLYRMLYGAIELRGAPFFGWITDLSAPDRFLSFDIQIPFMEPPYGIPILTIIMGLSMYVQQKITPTGGDPTQAKIMMLMPIILTVVFVNFPAGLVLYWLVNNVFSILQQYYITKNQ